jgi:DNA-binding CsgD family transcriptional regulator
MSSTFDIARITERFAAAALDPLLWDSAMDDVARASGGSGAVLVPVKGKLSSIPRSASMDRCMEQYVGDGWIHRDKRYDGTGIMIERGVVCDLDFMSIDEINRHPYYQDLLAPHGFRWFAGVRVASGDDLWVLTLQRSISQGPFSRDQLKNFAALSHSLSTAAAVSSMLGAARIDAALAAFEASGSAAVLLDRRGDVLRLNGKAHSMLGPDLQIIQKRLISSDRDGTAALDRAIQDLIWRLDGPSLLAPVVLRRQEGRPILAYPSRVEGMLANDVFVHCRIAIVLCDLGARAGPAETDLMNTFHLTPSEAKLATRLAAGASLAEAARALHIASGTARTQLKAIFAKTDTNKQGALVSLLARFQPTR